MTTGKAGMDSYESSHRTMVSLTFDDGLDVQLDVAIPTLDRAGLHGTFFIDVGNGSFSRRHDDWAAAAANGHELGNHSIFHPGVSSKPWATEGIALENYSLDRMKRELEVASQILSIVDGQVERTFAFPCSNPFLGAPGWPRRMLTRLGLQRTRIMGWVDRFGLDVGSRLVDYTPLARELFIAARCGGIDAGKLPNLPPDRHRVRGVAGDDQDLPALMAAVEAAIARDSWLVLVFHGVGGGHHMACDTDVFSQLVERLAADKRVQVVTFLEGARRCWPAVKNDA
jgi:peptidoglycan/xylan/chitin deacetylase (PgdA/CDA1 family)